MVENVNLIVPAAHNYPAMNMSIRKAAQGLIKKGQEATEGLLNMVEMAFRAYDPCFGCASHAESGKTPLIVRVFNDKREQVQELRRD